MFLAILVSVASSGEADPPDPDRGADVAVLRSNEAYSLMPPTALWGLPEFSLYGDGRVITRDGSDGALLRGRQYQITDAAVDGLFADAAVAGLLRNRSHLQSDILDGSLLTITVRSTDSTYVTTVSTPGEWEFGNRGRVIGFRHRLDVRRWPDTWFTGAPTEYRPAALAVIVAGATPDAADTRPWPLASPATTMPGWPRRPCVVLTGDRAREAAALARTARPNTGWESEGKVYWLVFRPLLPDEPSCTDVERF